MHVCLATRNYASNVDIRFIAAANLPNKQIPSLIFILRLKRHPNAIPLVLPVVVAAAAAADEKVLLSIREIIDRRGTFFFDWPSGMIL